MTGCCECANPLLDVHHELGDLQGVARLHGSQHVMIGLRNVREHPNVAEMVGATRKLPINADSCRCVGTSVRKAGAEPASGTGWQHEETEVQRRLAEHSHPSTCRRCCLSA